MQPFAWCMGIPWNETEAVGKVLGLKLLTEETEGLLLLGKMRRNALISVNRMSKYILQANKRFSL